MKVAEIHTLDRGLRETWALVLFILAQGAKSMLHRVYALWGCSIVVWNIGTAFMFKRQESGASADVGAVPPFWRRLFYRFHSFTSACS